MSGNEERLQEVFNQAAVGIALIDLNGEWLSVNPGYCEMLGYSEAELRTKTLEELTHPDDWDAVVSGRHQLRAGEITSHTMEKRFIRKDGAIFWGRLHRSLVRDRDNHPKYFIAVVEDVTDKIEAERGLRISQQRLELSQSAGGIATWDLDIATGEIHCSNGFGTLYGLAPGNIGPPPDKWLDLIHPEDRSTVQATMSQTLAGRDHCSSEYRVVWPDGTIHWLYSKGQLFRDSRGNPTRVIGVNMDITERKGAEAALRESEERFENMADAAPTMIWKSGTDKLCTFFNKPWLDFTGRTMEQELGNGWAEGVHPEDLNRCLDIYTSSFDTRERFKMEYRLRRADREYRWVLDIGMPLYSGGEFIGYIGSCVDITEQKLIEERLRVKEGQLVDAQRLAKVGSWELDLRADTLHWSDEMFRIFGLTGGAPPNFAGFMKLVHPGDREKILEADAKVRSSFGPVEEGHRIIRPDGETRFLHTIAQAVRDDQGVLVRIAGAVQDVTERVKASKLLRETEERFRSIADSAPVIVWVCGPDGAVTFTNRFGLNFIGRTLEQELGTGWTNLLHPDDRERVASEFSSAIAGHDMYQTSFRLRRADGEYRWMLVKGAPRFAGDVYSGHTGITIDITELKQSQERLQAAQKLESLGFLASGIAHDFNNLLGGILAEAELVEMDLAADSAAREEIQRVKTAAMRGSEIVRELMIYAGTDQRDVVETVDISQLVKEMLELLKVSIPKQVVLKTDFREDLRAVRANASQIRQVVMNLVLNAAEAIGGATGVITVTTAPASGGRGAVSNNAEDLTATPHDYMRLEVTDTGSGMTEDTKGKIFDPFFSTKFPGRGLGLAVVRGIVRDLGGAIDVVSAPGKGTAFQVFLPCAPKRASEIHRAITAGGLQKTNARAGTVFVVEDEDTLRRSISLALLKRGYSVIEASDGSAAMDQIHSHIGDIDLVLLDVTLPGISSREVFEEARRLRPDLRVIVTSAYGEEMVRAYYSGVRVDYFVRKPFHLDDLVRLFETARKASAARTP